MDKHSCSLKTCRKADDEDDMVACDRCKRWWHYGCASFEPDLYDTATPWFCNQNDCSARSEECPKSAHQQSGEGTSSIQSDIVGSVDLLLEAAAVAQAAVAERDNELSILRAEVEKLKLKLSESSPVVVPPAAVSVGVSKASTTQKPDERLEMIRRVQANHESLLKKSFKPHQSTPFRERQGEHDSFHESSAFRETDMSSLLTILNRNNVQELPAFSGANKREWPYFEEVFKSTTIEGRYSGKENVARLRKALTGEAYQLVSDRLKYSSDADAIMDSLRAIFGRYDVLVHDLTADLFNLPKLSSNSDPKLRSWAVKINGFVADIKSMNREEALSNGYVLTNLASKLGAGLYQEWQKKRASTSRTNFVDFAEFLTGKVVDLPPELMSAPASGDSKRVDVAARSSRRVLTHQPVPAVNPILSCEKCGRSQHPLSQCADFKTLSAEQRLAYAREKFVCFTCLNFAKHDWRACARKRTCGVGGCSGRHHPLLHQMSSPGDAALNTEAAVFVPQPHIHSSHVGSNLAVMFKVVPIRIHGVDQKFVDTFAFLDDGSSLTMVEKEIFDELGLDGKPEDLTLQWTKGVSRHEDSMRTTLTVSGVSNRKRYMLKDVYTVKNLDLPSQSLDVAKLKASYPHLRGLPLTDLVNAKPKILVGLDQARFLLGHGQRHGKEEEPCALKTLLGWIVFGKSAPTVQVSCLHQSVKPSMQLMFHDAIKSDEKLHDLVKRHFTTEEFGVMPPKGDLVGREVRRALDIMERSLRLVNNNCYEIGLLWDAEDVKLPDSYPMALHRLIGLEKSLKKKPHLLEWKNNHMRDMVAKGYARIASEEELQQRWPRVWYAPTFVVVNPNKYPPKPRDVADVAAKVGGVSLNTHLLKGPDNLVPLHAGIFKFREREIAINADVKEMFHRIRITEEDQHCQRILWRDGDSSKKPTIYIMQVMMFGPRCSPTCAQFVKNYHANLFREECPEAVDGLTKRTYVDDYFNSHDSIAKAVAVTKDAIRICKSMNFDLVGVQSNSSEVLKQMPESHVNPKLVSIDPNDCDNEVLKVLGMYWHPSSDYFTYKLSDDGALERMLQADSILTKREMLRTIMRIFDPLGLISLYIIRGRILLQEVWREGFNWDEPLSEELRIPWLGFVKDLKNIEKLQIPRRYVAWSPDVSNVHLIVFVDASEKAFAAVAYLRFEHNGKVEVVQVMAKAKVAPVKKLSIPRLELQAAVLGLRLSVTIKNSHTIRIDETSFLSDSKTVLSWINSSTYKFPSFVAVRVGEILDSSSPRQWFYIGSHENVADDGTKWFDSPMGNQESRWFMGPGFLKSPTTDWPIKPGKIVNIGGIEEVSNTNLMLHVKELLGSFDIYNELSARFRARWTSSVRCLAFMLRFSDFICKRSFSKQPFVTPEEFCRAEDWLFRKIQRDAFPGDIASLRMKGKVSPSSSILSLSPFLDKDGTIRLSSRAQKAKVSYASRNPAILPKTHPLVDVFIQHYHDRNLHSGTASIISDIRERAWIISIRGAVERIRARCNTCKRLKAKPVMPVMGQLPEARLAFDMRPFTHVGVDCFGPLLVKFGRGTVKRYGMIFTCLTFRAVQIELLNDLSLDHCTMALRRFVINRVVTRFLYSDNGLNFIGSKNQLDKDIRDMETALSEYAAKYEHILWRFIPAYSPWMGGAWERLIQSIKRSIEFVLKGVIPQEDVLRNALMEAQGQINRRPLTHIPVDPEDPKPLTPNSMLFGEEDRDVTAPGVFTESDQYSKLHSRRAQHLMAEIRRRWYTEYLPVITRRGKWCTSSKPVEVDDVVIIIEPNESRAAWQLGRVVKVYPGPDGVVRVADVRLANGSIKAKRSVGRLAVLDVKSSL